MHMRLDTAAGAALAWLLLAITAATGCSHMPPRDETYDPLVTVNRPLYTANEYLDRTVGQPVTNAYHAVTPQPAQTAIANFFDNIAYINVILNDFLQGKGKQGLADSGRFLVNSTVGIGGLFDPATAWGFRKHEEDFGQTLGVWGVGEGPYLVLPLLGPKLTRDLPDIAAGATTSLLIFVAAPVAIPLTVLGFIDRRARADQAIAARNAVAVDPYVFTREGYRQRRIFLLYDGDPPLPDMFDDVEEELQVSSAERPAW